MFITLRLLQSDGLQDDLCLCPYEMYSTCTVGHKSQAHLGNVCFLRNTSTDCLCVC